MRTIGCVRHVAEIDTLFDYIAFRTMCDVVIRDLVSADDSVSDFKISLCPSLLDDEHRQTVTLYYKRAVGDAEWAEIVKHGQQLAGELGDDDV
jgi:hypothetical protein